MWRSNLPIKHQQKDFEGTFSAKIQNPALEKPEQDSTNFKKHKLPPSQMPKNHFFNFLLHLLYLFNFNKKISPRKQSEA